MKYHPIYYYNMYAPWRVIRRFASRLVYDWADRKYGREARGPFASKLTARQIDMLEKWHYWMNIKNRIGN